jgi:hypothetical protein
LLLAGCVHSKQPAKNTSTPAKTNSSQPHVTPNFATVGRVEMVNNQGRFVVLSFPPGHVPPPGQHWRVSHQGLKVARVVISGPQRDIDTVADILEGQATVGDEATPE